MGRIISPSVLSADFGHLASDVAMLNESRAEWIHIDVMDGVFVPNISFGFPILKAVKASSAKVMDVHLMIVQPERYIDEFARAGADYLTVHVEASTHLHRTLQAVRGAGMKAGVSLNPHTPLSSIEEIVADADLVLIMSVNPGYGGQKFIEASLDKVARLKELLLKKNSQALIEVDGGVTLGNARSLFDAGADVLVAGNTVFSSSDPKDTIAKLLEV